MTDFMNYVFTFLLVSKVFYIVEMLVSNFKNHISKKDMLNIPENQKGD